jgi:hypothetical protein
MRKIQVIFGEHREEDFRCKLCNGVNSACFFCGGKPLTSSYRGYTYALPEGMPDVALWDLVWVPDGLNARAFPKTATVVALTSDYDGPVREVIPNQRLSTGNAPMLRPPARQIRTSSLEEAPEWTL